jgi:hypothetical protein
MGQVYRDLAGKQLEDDDTPAPRGGTGGRGRVDTGRGGGPAVLPAQGTLEEVASAMQREGKFKGASMDPFA